MANHSEDEFAGVTDEAQAESTACASNRAAPSNADRRMLALDFIYLLAERDLPGTTTNPIVYLSQIATPVLSILALVTFFNAEWSVLILLIGAILALRTLLRLNRNAAEQRAALLIPDVDVRWVEALIDSLNVTDSRIRRIAQLRLTTLLPTMALSDEPVISSLYLSQLFNSLTPALAHKDADFVIAIMNFASSKGLAQAIDGMEALTEMRAFSSAQRRVRRAARGFLPVFEERVAGIYAKSTESTIRHGRSYEDDTQDRSLSPQAQAWLEEIEREAHRSPGMRFGFLLASWMVIVPYFAYLSLSMLSEREYLYALMFGLTAALSTQLYRLTLTPQQAQLGEKLASVDEVGAVGPLVEMTAWPDDRIKAQAYSALTRLLPRMRSSDTHLLSAKQRAILYQGLYLANAKEHPEYLIALLSALEQVGDTDAIPFVKALTDSQPYTIRQRRVVAAATECLPFLEVCARQNTDSQVLLRATTSSDPEASLLRPVTATSSSDPELLVRIPSIQE